MKEKILTKIAEFIDENNDLYEKFIALADKNIHEYEYEFFG